jgi:hypothetical protein
LLAHRPREAFALRGVIESLLGHAFVQWRAIGPMP